jgi:hypothetical protein
MPGLGKSVLPRVLLEERAFDEASATICHLLKGSKEESSIAIAMRALVLALSCGNEDLFRNHAEKIVQMFGGQLGFDFESLWQMGTFAGRGFSLGKVVYILDAWDEVHLPKSDQLMQMLERLSGSSKVYRTPGRM